MYFTTIPFQDGDVTALSDGLGLFCHRLILTQTLPDNALVLRQRQKPTLDKDDGDDDSDDDETGADVMSFFERPT